MNYKKIANKLLSLNKFLNGKHQDDIILILNKKYDYDAWNLICAIMHWFNVVSPYLDSSKVLKKKTKDYNWGNVYLYLCAVDIVTKGINKLYQMINNTDVHIFNKEHDVFNNTKADDNNHFQNIRAIFGAHPTDLNGNGNFFVATYPTPYNWNIDQITGNGKSWDYYTLLWSKDKKEEWLQKSVGFSFHDIDKYLEKNVNYLDVFYSELVKMIDDYYKKKSNKRFGRINDIYRQIDVLIQKDNKWFNGRYNYILEKYKLLICVEITDEYNKKEYEVFRKKLISKISYVVRVIDNPSKYKSLSFLDELIECDNFDNNHYYYSKLMEYYNNYDMTELLINYYGDKIEPFNSNINSLEELYCLVKAKNYYDSNN